RFLHSSDSAALPHPPPFPTRRSSDLGHVAGAQPPVIGERLARARVVVVVGRDPRAPGLQLARRLAVPRRLVTAPGVDLRIVDPEDRKSTRLNSSHQIISYAVFCLKKK